jgi:hypothetical protein
MKRREYRILELLEFRCSYKYASNSREAGAASLASVLSLCAFAG